MEWRLICRLRSKSTIEEKLKTEEVNNGRNKRTNKSYAPNR